MFSFNLGGQSVDAEDRLPWGIHGCSRSAPRSLPPTLEVNFHGCLWELEGGSRGFVARVEVRSRVAEAILVTAASAAVFAAASCYVLS